jgi:ribonuclease P protein component
VLARAARLRSSGEFTAVMRRRTGHGRGAGAALVVHAALESDRAGPPRFGFAVPRAVGSAVVRNRVRRRLRALCAARQDALPDGVRVVVRALAPAAGMTFAALGTELDRCLSAALRRALASGADGASSRTSGVAMTGRGTASAASPA